MTIQFNLIPDIKSQYLKARRLQRIVVGGAGIAVAVCIVILVILILLVDVKQKHDMSSLTGQITQDSAKIKSIKGLNDIITVQNQLETLPNLYSQDPQVSRLFGYVTQLTPPNVTIGDLTLNLSSQSGSASSSSADTIDIKGSAPALSDVNSYTDTLKSATYDDTTSGTTNVPAFSSVVLTSFSRDNQGATYTIDFSFDPILFQSSEKVTLNVPKTTNAPQVPGVDGKIFKALPKNSNNQPQGQAQGGQ